MRFCRQYINEKEMAEEIVSDVFVDIWLKRNALQHVMKPEVYMMVCIKNRALNQGKKNTYMQLVPIDEETETITDGYQPDEEMERKELFMQLDRAVASLPQQCRLIFKLTKEEGMKCAEVAEILNISVRTVHAQVYRAMTKLNAIMLAHQTPRSAATIRNIASTIIMLLFIH